MSDSPRDRLRMLEGRYVSVALRDGRRLDDCHLVSVGRQDVTSVWLFADRMDLFVALEDVIDVWEVDRETHRRAA